MKHVCILARKKLRYNARIHRQVRSLSQAGYHVSVIALAEDGLPSYENTPYCEIYRVKLVGIWIPSFVKSSYRWVRGILRRYSQSPEARRQPSYLVLAARLLLPLLQGYRWLAMAFRQFLRAAHPPVDFVFGLKAFRKVSRHPAEIYLAHDSYPLISAYVFSRKHDARLIYDAVEFNPDRNVARGHISGMLSSFQQKFEAKIVRKADAVLTVGDSIAELISTHCEIPQPTVVRHCPEYTPGVEPRPILDPRGRKVIVYAGSITSNNGLEQLIQAMQYLDDAVAVIMGPISELAYEKHLRRLVGELGVRNKVHLARPVERHEVVSFVSSADVGVIPIQKNCLNHVHISPNKLYEYIAARIPVATGDFPTITPLVKTFGIGEIFDETSPESIALTIDYILKRRKSYEGALEDCARALCWENESPKMIDVLARTEQI